MSNDGLAYRECISCGILIEKPFWLCQTCEDTHGVANVPCRFWPRYLRDLYNMAQRSEYQARRFAQVCIDSLDDVPCDSEGHALDSTEYVTARRYDPDMEWGLLRYAPYADDEQNRAYRRSNNIAER